MPTPLKAHLIWYGPSLPWVYGLAVQSALLRGGFEEVWLHHDHDLSASSWWPTFTAHPAFRSARLGEALEMPLPEAHAARLRELYETLPTPASKSDLLRAALLYAHGGVYLDMDTVTVRSLAPLCAQHTAFIGLEHIVYPAALLAHGRPLARGAAHLRAGVRDLFRRLPSGWKHFRRIEAAYVQAANPAIMGSAPGSAVMEALLARMAHTTLAQLEAQRAALGPHNVQALVEGEGAASSEATFDVLPPAHFYPLSPEISEHWFRPRKQLDLDEVLPPQTQVVHWYASSRTRPWLGPIDADFVRSHQHSQFFSALAAPFLPTA